MRYIPPKKHLHHLANLLTYRWTLLNSTVNQGDQLKVNRNISPLWVTGLFRSGTSVTTRILSELGFDLGPERHLLKGRGSRANWNRNGFYENFLFMDWSLSVFEALDSWGHAPPTEEKVRNYNINELDYKKYVYQSIVEIHDDRISNVNKINALKHYSPKTANKYLEEQFKAPLAIKNPHFSVLSGILTKYWPRSSFLVVFRNPDATISSAQKVTPAAGYSLYINYYSRLLEKKNTQVSYFSYDNLIRDPEGSINALVEQFQLSAPSKQVLEIVDPGLYHHRQEQKNCEWPDALRSIYSRMQARVINKS